MRLHEDLTQSSRTTATANWSFRNSTASNSSRARFPPASSSSHDQQPNRPTPIPSQRRLTQLLTKHWAPFKALRQCYAGTRFEEQRQLHLPQKHKATVQDSNLRVEMNALEEQADNAKARDLYWKPLSWLGTIRPTSANFAFDPALWATSSHSHVDVNHTATSTLTTQPRAQLTKVQPRHMIGW